MRVAILVAAAGGIIACGRVQASRATDPSPSPPAHGLPADAAGAPQPPPAPVPATGRQPVEVEMQNVDLHVTPDITLMVRALRGRFVPTGRTDAPYLDDKHSYTVVLDSAEIALDMASLNALVGRVTGRGHSNLDDLVISTDEGLLRQKGEIDKKIDIPFDVKGEMDAAPDGRIRVHTRSVRSFLGLNVTKIMKLLSIEMDDLVKLDPGRGAEVRENDLLLDPQRMLPAPRMRGRVTAVRVQGDRVVQSFGTRAWRQLTPPAISRNHIYWRGGDLQFGKLTMTHTDLELVDLDPSDPFDFSVDHWNDQLVAGYSKNTTDRGLKAYMPDHDDLGRQRRAATRSRPGR